MKLETNEMLFLFANITVWEDVNMAFLVKQMVTVFTNILSHAANTWQMVQGIVVDVTKDEISISFTQRYATRLSVKERASVRIASSSTFEEQNETAIKSPTHQSK